MIAIGALTIGVPIPDNKSQISARSLNFQSTLPQQPINIMVNVTESSKVKEERKTTTDDGSSDDEQVPELEEGEVTEEQKKVAEAIGLSEQVCL